MAAVYRIKVSNPYDTWMVEIVADDERTARLQAAHAHCSSIKGAKLVEVVDSDYHGEFYTKGERI